MSLALRTVSVEAGSFGEPVPGHDERMSEVQDRIALPRPAPADSCVLARVPGQCIAQASKSLPDPACALDEEVSVEVDTVLMGRVRLIFKKQGYSKPRGNVAYFSWLCKRAERVVDPSTRHPSR